MFGMTFYYVMALGLAVFLLSRPKKPNIKIPAYLWIYGIVLVGMDLYWFNVENWWYYISNLAPYFLAFIFILYGITTKDAFNRFIDFIIVIFAIYALFCIIESITYFNIFDSLTHTKVEEYLFTNEIRFGFVRNRGAVDISINNGMLQCLVLSLCSYRIATNRQIKYVVSFCLIFLASFLSLSRGVWVQLLISQALVVMVMPGRKKIMLILKTLLALFLVLLIGSVMSSGFTEKIADLIENMFLSIASVFTESNNSNMIGVGHRFLLWSWVFNTIGSSLVFGLGVGANVSVTTSLGYNKVSIEVMWLYVMYQMGLIGLIGFVVFQIGSIRYSIKHLKKKKYGDYYNNFNYYILAASVGYFIALFACSGFEDLRFYYIIVALGICYNHLFNYDKPKRGNVNAVLDYTTSDFVS